MKNTDDMVLYEVLTPEKVAALIAGGGKKNAAPAKPIVQEKTQAEPARAAHTDGVTVDTADARLIEQADAAYDDTQGGAVSEGGTDT